MNIALLALFFGLSHAYMPKGAGPKPTELVSVSSLTCWSEDASELALKIVSDQVVTEQQTKDVSKAQVLYFWRTSQKNLIISFENQRLHLNFSIKNQDTMRAWLRNQSDVYVPLVCSGLDYKIIQ